MPPKLFWPNIDPHNYGVSFGIDRPSYIHPIRTPSMPTGATYRMCALPMFDIFGNSHSVTKPTITDGKLSVTRVISRYASIDFMTDIYLRSFYAAGDVATRDQLLVVNDIVLEQRIDLAASVAAEIIPSSYWLYVDVVYDFFLRNEMFT